MADQDKSKRKGKNCWGGGGPGGDVTIALECDASETLLTTDHSFDHIGPALGLTVDRFAPTKRPTAG